MNNLIKYEWWGNNNSPPENLKTKKQLTELGLKGVNPVGFIETSKYKLYLYDANNSESVQPKKQPTEKQLKAWEIAREKARFTREYKEWYYYVGRHYKAINSAIDWARDIIKNQNNYVVLDTETTGFNNAEIVQISIIDLDKNILLDSLVKPTIPIPDEVSSIHGITDEMVIKAPKFPEIYPQIKKAIKGKKVLIYNADFDRSILNYCCYKHNIPILELQKEFIDVMIQNSLFVAEWSNYHNDYKWQALEGEHTAIEDCIAVVNLIKKMATSKIKKPTENYFRENIYQKNKLITSIDND